MIRSARHKTLNYWRKRIAQAQAIEAGSDDVLCLTPAGLICETCRANIFLVEGRRLITPGLDGPLLPGVMRGSSWNEPGGLGIEVEEGPVPLRTDQHRRRGVSDQLVVGYATDRPVAGSRAAGPGTGDPAALERDLCRGCESGGTRRP